jgi:hypothetical protein
LPGASHQLAGETASETFSHPGQAGEKVPDTFFPLHLFEGEKQLFIPQRPDSPASIDALGKMVEFVHRETV